MEKFRRYEIKIIGGSKMNEDIPSMRMGNTMTRWFILKRM